MQEPTGNKATIRYVVHIPLVGNVLFQSVLLVIYLVFPTSWLACTVPLTEPSLPEESFQPFPSLASLVTR
jgi:hypothetical protein